MKSCRNKARNVRHINKENCADLFCNLSDALKVNLARIGGSAGNNHFRLTFKRGFFKRVIVDIAVFVNAVGEEVIELSAEVDLCAVSKVAAVRKAHSEHGIARLEESGVNGKVRLGAGVRLNIGVFRREKLLCPFNRKVFNNINTFAAAVIPP